MGSCSTGTNRQNDQAVGIVWAIKKAKERVLLSGPARPWHLNTSGIPDGMIIAWNMATEPWILEAFHYHYH